MPVDAVAVDLAAGWAQVAPEVVVAGPRLAPVARPVVDGRYPSAEVHGRAPGALIAGLGQGPAVASVVVAGARRVAERLGGGVVALVE